MADNNEKISYGFADNFGFTSPFGENSIFSQQSRDKEAAQRALREQQIAQKRLLDTEPEPLPCLPIFTVTADYKGEFGFDTWDSDKKKFLTTIIKEENDQTEYVFLDPDTQRERYGNEREKGGVSDDMYNERKKINAAHNIKNGKKLPKVYQYQSRRKKNDPNWQKFEEQLDQNTIYIFARMGQSITLNLALLFHKNSQPVKADDFIHLTKGITNEQQKQSTNRIKYELKDDVHKKKLTDEETKKEEESPFWSVPCSVFGINPTPITITLPKAIDGVKHLSENLELYISYQRGASTARDIGRIIFWENKIIPVDLQPVKFYPGVNTPNHELPLFDSMSKLINETLKKEVFYFFFEQMGIAFNTKDMIVNHLDGLKKYTITNEIGAKIEREYLITELEKQQKNRDRLKVEISKETIEVKKTALSKELEATNKEILFLVDDWDKQINGNGNIKHDIHKIFSKAYNNEFRGMLLFLTSFKVNDSTGGEGLPVPIQAKHVIYFANVIGKNFMDSLLHATGHEIGHALGLLHNFELSITQREITKIKEKIKEKSLAIQGFVLPYSAQQEIDMLELKLYKRAYDEALIEWEIQQKLFFAKGYGTNLMNYNTDNNKPKYYNLFFWQWKIARDKAKLYYKS